MGRQKYFFVILFLYRILGLVEMLCNSGAIPMGSILLELSDSDVSREYDGVIVKENVFYM